MVPEGFTQTKDLTGQALPDATINIIDLTTGAIIATTTTDATGYYQVAVPPGGPDLLEAVKGSVKLEQITCQVEVGIEYDLGTADCVSTSAALIAQAMMDAGDNPADINCADIIADSNFDDVSGIVCATIKAGGDPTVSAAVQQAVEDFLNPPASASTPNPTPTPLSDAKAITAFDFKALEPNVIGAIDEGAKTIALTVPFGTNVNALVPTIVHTGKSVSPASGEEKDFTSPVIYSVTADDTSTQAYLITVTEAAAVIDIAAIPGVTVPATGATPVTTITPTAQYAGTVAWSVAWNPDDLFQSLVFYIATITLTPKSGFILTGVAEDFFTVAGAVATNPIDSGEVTARFLVVGASYGGGKVAYILQSGDPGYVAGEQHGLIATTDDQSNIVWATTTNDSDAVPGGTLITIGSGSANTDKIIVQNGAGSTYAAGLARAYDGGGYSDWFLPSKNELNKLYDNRVAIGGFADRLYWSSSETIAEYAWSQDFLNGDQYGGYDKYNTFRIRAVRAF